MDANLIFTIFLNFFEKNNKEWKIWKPYPASQFLYLFQGTLYYTKQINNAALTIA
jgi:hypothetical protein